MVGVFDRGISDNGALRGCADIAATDLGSRPADLDAQPCRVASKMPGRDRDDH